MAKAKQAGKYRLRIKDRLTLRAGDLIPHPENWRLHPPEQRDAMVGVLEQIGITDTLKVVKRGRRYQIIDGHLRADLDPDDLIPCDVLDLNEEEARFALATHDWVAQLAESDSAGLADLMRDFDPSNAALGALFGDYVHEVDNGPANPNEPRQGLTAPDAVPSLADPISELGDVWILGAHRVVCGDATDAAAFSALMNGEAAAMMWTDPPYGVEYVGKTKDALTLDGDAQSGLKALLNATFANCDAVLAPAAPFYICHPSGANAMLFGSAVLEAGWSIRETLIWIKDSMVLGHSDYHYRHEPIFYAARDDEEPQWFGDFMDVVKTHEPLCYGWTRGARHPWYGGRSETSVFMIDRPKASREHPTMKPTALVEKCIRNSSKPGDVILDPFLGSGSTLLAAERLTRACYGIEIDPRYVDVIVRRWQSFTGEAAKIETSGKVFDEVAAARTRKVAP